MERVGYFTGMGWVGGSKAKTLRESMKVNWNFEGGWEGEGV